METIKFIGVLCATWLFTTGAGSVQWAKGIFKLGYNDEPRAIWMKAIRTLVNCSMCSGFWIGISYYQDFLMGCIIAIAAELFNRGIKFLL